VVVRDWQSSLKKRKDMANVGVKKLLLLSRSGMEGGGRGPEIFFKPLWALVLICHLLSISR
jgi:hypothetical protein